MKYNRVLTIAGSDSGGGAGIQADIKSISACGCYASSAITAITAQNTIGVRDIHSIPVAILKSQIEAVLDDIGTDSIKIGMLHSTEIIQGVADCLDKYQIKNVVLDPVMVATSGDKLLQDNAISHLKNVLFPRVRIITPNLPEAEILLGRKIKEQSRFREISKELAEMYQVSVLLKAGHLSEENLVDVIYNFETSEWTDLASKRIDTKNTHGTGCTLSSALAAFLAKGFGISESAIKAKDYIAKSIIEGTEYEIGKGHGPVHHFHQFWD
ncbi:bifunctional hydroxymethylpyrimidine kinase/phosphomethylpyrimidine kinase [Ancylomarina sp. 16SWW S1-10-2]|uniref:bifunctional hydroxymethylpyrimidine kinase/phosphomethylpyrimidine kinase n=1 Tax=Ancylomarina sp. 16SWW S1-10-2 TaxID=2499681 RepID=UPI0012AD332C|nr:bifunctional hydroxymethylpyrimidine kinase/phosphomethylpyrimidine kinase [Ancylomarina sp. 16SWW S1-10-2]MRT92748.1 bifunctional hydroxymethylpyrimidine kinase/phosphomethylpyrimidine kinase [Ancylomarina sp. 16SWW S1-10-2]